MGARLCLVTDIHHGPPSMTKRGDAALALMEGFVRFANDAAPDLVVDLGDRITDVDRDTDQRLAAEIAAAFRPVTAPVQHLDGNHDLDNLTVEENGAVLGRTDHHQVVDIGGWRIALWRADAKLYRGVDGRGFVLREADLLWLSRVAQATDRPLLVLSHVPVSGHAQTGNYYFQNNPPGAGYPMADRARAAVAQAGHPVVCMAGHVHWNTVCQIDGVVHLTQQSLTESFTTQGEPAAAWGLLELSDTVRWRVFGLDPIDLTITPKPARWTPPLPAFQDHRELALRRQGVLS